MRYLITGAGGFIGGAVAERLIRDGHECVTIDNFSTGFTRRVPKQCQLLEGNAYDENIIARLKSMPKFDAVIHLAGQSSGEVSFYNPIYDLQTNVQSTLLLLKFAAQSGVPKFIYAGSMAVYGDPPDNAPCTEQTPAVPKSFYAVGKLASENYMRIFAQHYGLCCTSLRFFNVYGVGQNLDNLRQGMVSIFLAQALKNHHIDVKGSLQRFRDLVYIDDAVDAVIAALSRERGMEVFNVCTQIPTTVSEMIDAIRANVDFPVTVSVIDGTPGDQFGIYGSFAKISEQLHWTPAVRFDTGIKLMTAWAKEFAPKNSDSTTNTSDKEFLRLMSMRDKHDMPDRESSAKISEQLQRTFADHLDADKKIFNSTTNTSDKEFLRLMSMCDKHDMPDRESSAKISEQLQQTFADHLDAEQKFTSTRAKNLSKGLGADNE